MDVMGGWTWLKEITGCTDMPNIVLAFEKGT